MKHLAILAALAATPAFGQTTCAEREAIATVLAESFQEAQRVAAINGGQVLEFWGNEDTGTWTLLLSDVHGTSCIMGGGTGFVIEDAPPIGEAM